MVFIFLSQLSLAYLILYKPYEERYTNLNEIFNESCLLVAAYMLVIFTGLVDNNDTKEGAGNLLIGVILANFTVNILI